MMTHTDAFETLADPTRRRIVEALRGGERPVGEIVAEAGVHQSGVSRHLGLMHRHHMVARRKDGAQVYYSVADPAMIELCREVCGRIARTVEERRPARRQLLKVLPTPKRRATA